jgi:hypothetical protein
MLDSDHSDYDSHAEVIKPQTDRDTDNRMTNCFQRPSAQPSIRIHPTSAFDQHRSKCTFSAVPATLRN